MNGRYLFVGAYDIHVFDTKTWGCVEMFDNNNKVSIFSTFCLHKGLISISGNGSTLCTVCVTSLDANILTSTCLFVF